MPLNFTNMLTNFEMKRSIACYYLEQAANRRRTAFSFSKVLKDSSDGLKATGSFEFVQAKKAELIKEAKSYLCKSWNVLVDSL